VSAEEEAKVRALIETLNPFATLMATKHGKVGRLEALMNTGMFPMVSSCALPSAPAPLVST
jgi:hypothetical protein